MIYLLLNFVVIGLGIIQIVQRPFLINDWQASLFNTYQNPFRMLGLSLLLFPKLALGLSGFETGAVVMPLVKGSRSDTQKQSIGRIQNTYKLLTMAAFIMSFFLLTSSLVTTLLIPSAEFQVGEKPMDVL